MKTLLVALCTFACAYAASVSDAAATILRSDFQHFPDESFRYSYETDSGISASAEGKYKTVGKDEVALEVIGSSQFVAPDGQKIETTYIANENGYQAQGAHLPTPPAPVPIPDYIARAIEYIAAHPYKEVQS